MIETRFKDTEVGRIPEDWSVKKIGDIATICGGGTPSTQISSYWGGSLNWFTPAEIAQEAGYVFKSDRTITNDGLNNSSAKLLPKGSILLTTRATIGNRAIAGCEVCTNQGFQSLIPKGINNHFLYYHISTIVKGMYANASGSTFLEISGKKLSEINISVPTDIEQTRIASALTSIDNLISSLDKLIEKKKNIKQGTMQQLLTGKKRLKGFSEPWMEKYLKDSFLIIVNNCCSREELSDTGKVLNVHYGDVLIKFGAVIDVKNNHLPYIVGKDVASRPLKDGDIIMADTAEDEACGKVCEIRGINDLQVESGLHTIALRPLDVYGERFLGYYMNSTAFHDLLLPLMQGTKVTSISKSALMNVGFSVPSSIEEQTAIASVLCSMDNEISALEAKKAKYESMKQGMMQQLLTGRIRLVETAAKTDTTTANRYFRRSVLAAEIADRLCEEPTFGHVKMEKMLFLVERLCHLDIGSQYHRDAAGPYDNRAIFSIDSQLKSQKWFEAQKTAKGVRYIPMQKRGGHKSYFDRYYSDVLPIFDKVINTFKRQKTEQCEIVATLYSAWEDLLLGNKPCTDADIVDEVLNNWHESKKRIPPERWQRAIQWMRENDFAPKQDDL